MMRTYGTTTVAGYIRQKNDIGLRYGKPARQLTAEDFEWVPEHEEEQLIDVRCDGCGVSAEFFAPGPEDESESSLFSLQLFHRLDQGEATDCTSDFFPDYWYEFCESCMHKIVAPYLKGLRRLTAPAAPEAQEEEAAVVSSPEDRWRLTRNSQTTLIGAEDDGAAPLSLPPLSEDEPF